MPKCPACQAEIPDGARFCGACGKPIPEPQPARCQGCGVALPEGAKFCGVCGRPAGAAGMPAPAGPGASERESSPPPGSAPAPPPGAPTPSVGQPGGSGAAAEAVSPSAQRQTAPESFPPAPPPPSQEPPASPAGVCESAAASPPPGALSAPPSRRGRSATATVLSVIYAIAALVFAIFGGRVIADSDMTRADLDDVLGVALVGLAVVYLIGAILVWVVRPRAGRGIALALALLLGGPGALAGFGYVADTYFASPETLYWRGVGDFYGIYGRQDVAGGLKNLQRASDRGHAGATERLAFCHLYGLAHCGRDLAEAKRLYDKAIEQGGCARIYLGLAMLAQMQGDSKATTAHAREWNRRLGVEQKERAAKEGNYAYVVVERYGGKEKVWDVEPEGSSRAKTDRVVYGPDTYLECEVYKHDRIVMSRDSQR